MASPSIRMELLVLTSDGQIPVLPRSMHIDVYMCVYAYLYWDHTETDPNTGTLNVCIHTCTHMYINIHQHIYVCIYVNQSIYIYMSMYIFNCIYIYMCMYIDIDVDGRMQTNLSISIYIYILAFIYT